MRGLARRGRVRVEYAIGNDRLPFNFQPIQSPLSGFTDIIAECRSLAVVLRTKSWICHCFRILTPSQRRALYSHLL